MQAWKYTLPAFVVPFMFVLAPEGVGLLLKTPPGGDWTGVAWIAVTACIGIAAIAAGAQGWLLSRCNILERAAMIVGGLLLIYPGTYADAIGFVLVVSGAGMHVIRTRQANSLRRA
jgi:TRAP-type uncharacterized transport system fused permease subunit